MQSLVTLGVVIVCVFASVDSRVLLIWQCVKCADKEVIRRNAHHWPVLICDQFTLVFGRINAIWNLFPHLPPPPPPPALIRFDYLDRALSLYYFHFHFVSPWRRRRWVILISSTGNGLVWLQTTDHRTENYNFIYLANVVSPVSGMGWGRVATNYNIPHHFHPTAR